jgi:hypothetical protein
MLHQLEENFRAFDFKIIYRKGNEMSSDFSSHQLDPDQQQTDRKGPELRRMDQKNSRQWRQWK